ncbi:hypothetical protein Ahy_B09g096061 [Arachis hypogaea]|uniref:Uncharacterized protein n=1 Tax=Arachis hypogaea TaxID=3818 RepID=A0A444XI25_ARAHY|nr:hypothetical protein Ahy_B09g096061 [Arachis hypogaea]
MWVPIFFKGEFWASMRSTQRSESMHAFYGGFLHSKTCLVQFVHEYDHVLGVKEQRELEDDAIDSRGVSVVTEDGPVVCMKVEEEKLVHDTMLCVSYVVHFDRSTQELRCEYNLFESSVYKVPTCYVLPRWSKRIKRKHTYIKSSHQVSWSDVSHNAFKTRAKLSKHHAKKNSESVAETHTSIGSQNSNVVDVVDIQGPSLVTTKGRPKSKRLGAALEKSFRKPGRRKNKNASPVVHSNAYLDTNFGDAVGRNAPEQVGSFMSLLTSFDKS